MPSPLPSPPVPAFPLPHDEPDRLRALYDLGILDTPDEERFDRITRTAARMFGVPIALVSLVDERRQWAKSCVGLDGRELPRGFSFCAQAILGEGELVIEDTLADPRFRDNAQVTGSPHLRFYAGHVLTSAMGYKLGTLCIAAPAPRSFTAADRAALADLAGWAEQELASSDLGEALAVRAETEVRLRAVMDTVADGVVSFGEDGIIESVNTAAERMFGMPRGFLLGERVDKLLGRTSWTRIDAALRDGRGSVIGRTIELTGRRGDYTSFPLELTVGRTRVGRRTLYVGVGRDLTARKRDERELDRTRMQNALLLETAGEGIVGIDRDGRVVFVNPAAARSLGREPSAMSGRHIDEVMPRATLDRVPVLFPGSEGAQAVADGGERRFERVVRRADGTEFPADFTVAGAHRSGVALGAVVVFRDISERYAVDRMKDEFVSVVGHELRTPLTSIRGSLGLLAGGVVGELTDEASRMVDIAVANTDRLVRLINDILDLERIEAGRLDLAREPRVARELLETTVDVVGAAAAERGVTLRIDAGEHLVVLVDQDRLVQALTNLAGNAIKYSPEGAEVVLRAAAIGDEVRFEVCDRGRGIPAEALERIFERFEQVDASDAREKGGTGLGLAIARSVVDQHGGRIWAESELGAGATFVIALPRLRERRERSAVLVVGGGADDAARLAPMLDRAGYTAATEADGGPFAAVLVAGEPAAAADALGRVHGVHDVAAVPIVFAGRQRDTELIDALDRAVPARATSRVLVVEDDRDLANVLARQLEAHGARVTLARTARQAIEAIDSVAPDLLVLDLVIPEGDGFAVVEHLRADPARAAIPLVVYTALDLDAADRGRLAGEDALVMTKGRTTPADVEEHVVRLLEALA